jgi:hydroxypyruvate reductase
MVRAALAELGSVPALVVVPRGGSGNGSRVRGLPRRSVLRASHPEPDASSVRAARRALSFFAGFGAGDAVLCLISGGASSLVALPRPGITLRHKRRAVGRLAASGATISEVNRLRRSLSAVKGGGLGRATAASLVTLVLSDVAGDDPSVVGSGPTIRSRRRRSDVVRVVGSNRDGVEAAAAEARRLGLEPRVERRRLAGEARSAGAVVARKALALAPGSVLVAGGETVVRLPRRRGRGGRCLELALGAAAMLKGSEVALLAAGSDGVDGSSGAAGAFCDGRTPRRAELRRLDPERALREHDTTPLFRALGDLFVTGPTGTNVGDWVFAVRPRSREP